MTSVAITRNTRRRDRHRRLIARGNPPCHICGEDIDYGAHYLEPLSFQIDHVIPLAKGGLDELENLAPSHRKCNREKSVGPRNLTAGGVTFVTSRCW